MSETNAIVTSEAGLVRTSVLLAGREAGGQQDAGFTSSPPLAGRKCPACDGRGAIRVCGGLFEKFVRCNACQGTGERSGPANTQLAD